MHNAHVKFNGDYDVDDLIDAIEGNRKYMRCIYVHNKIDTISIEMIEEMTQDPQNAVISVRDELGIDILLDKIWEQIGLVRVYTKRQGIPPDFNDPLILMKARQGLTVRSCLMQIHREFLQEFSHAMVWGRSAKFQPQRVGIDH
jgi:uncharacterized protein